MVMASILGPAPNYRLPLLPVKDGKRCCKGIKLAVARISSIMTSVWAVAIEVSHGLWQKTREPG